jgi:hypothetical protein
MSSHTSSSRGAGSEKSDLSASSGSSRTAREEKRARALSLSLSLSLSLFGSHELRRGREHSDVFDHRVAENAVPELKVIPEAVEVYLDVPPIDDVVHVVSVNPRLRVVKIRP